MNKTSIEHEKGLPLFVGCSIVALWAYCVLASFLGWIDAIWWGGKAMYVPVIGSVIIFFCAMILYVIIVTVWKKSALLDYYQLAFTGFVFGFAFFPAMELLVVIKVKQYLPLSFRVEKIILFILLNMVVALFLNAVVLFIRKMLSND